MLLKIRKNHVYGTIPTIVSQPISISEKYYMYRISVKNIHKVLAELYDFGITKFKVEMEIQDDIELNNF